MKLIRAIFPNNSAITSLSAVRGDVQFGEKNMLMFFYGSSLMLIICYPIR